VEEKEVGVVGNCVASNYIKLYNFFCSYLQHLNRTFDKLEHYSITVKMLQCITRIALPHS